MSKKVQVLFPGGRKVWMSPKTAESKTVVKMGGKIIEAILPPVKTYAPIVPEPVKKASVIDVPEIDDEDEYPVADFTKTVEEKKKPGRPKKEKN